MSKNSKKTLKEINKDLQFQIEQLNIILEEILKLNSTKKHEVLLQHVMASVTRLMKAEASSLMLLDEETCELVFEVALGDKKSFLSKLRIKACQGIAGWVLREGVPLVVSDVTKDPRFSDKVDEITGFKTRSILCAPLKVDNKIIGVVQALNPLDGSRFKEEDINIFAIFANLAAVSIQNSKVYNDLQTFFLKESQQQISRLEVMSQISGVTLNSMDFSNIFKAIMEIVIQALQAEAGIIFLLSEHKENFFPVVFRGFEEGALVEKHKLGISESIVREILKTGKPLKVEGFTLLPVGPGDKVSQEEMQTVIGIPVKTSEIMFGVIVVFSRKGGDISIQDIDFLKTFSAQLAFTIEKIDINQFSGRSHKEKAHKIDFSITKEEVTLFQLNALCEYIDKGLILTDSDFNILLVNKKAETLLGIKGDDLRGKNCINCHSVFLQDSVAKFKDSFLEGENTGGVAFTKKFRAENKTVNATLYPVKDPFFNICGFFMTMDEIIKEIKKSPSKREKAKTGEKREASSKKKKSGSSKKLFSEKKE